MDKVDTSNWRHYYENGEWKKESVENHQDRTQTTEERIEQLRRLHDLHQRLNEEMDGWGKVAAQTQERLRMALEGDDRNEREIEAICGN